MQNRVTVFLTIEFVRLISKVFLWLPASFISKIVHLITSYYHHPNPRPIQWLFVKEWLGEFSSSARLGWLQKQLRRMHPSCRRKFVRNFVVNTIIVGTFKKEEIKSKDKFYPPYTIMISPTMRCNLSCESCYARGYSLDEDLKFEIADRVISEGKQIGVYFYTVLGGEPFLWRGLFELVQKHKDAYFQVFTNGTLIKDIVIRKLIKLGNLMPVLSLEGFQDSTDEVRGKGVFNKVSDVMDSLNQHHMPFGISVCVTRSNMDEVSSDRFIDFTIRKGSLINWFFLYMPVGTKPDLDRMPTPEQRLKLKQRRDWIRKSRGDKIFIIDFWNDAPLVGGCIAGGRRFLHINSRGDVEPCIFQHFAVDNIKDKNLKEVLTSRLMKCIQQQQPFAENLYLPCMIIDHPQVLRDVINFTNAHPTHPGAESLVTDEKIITGLDAYSKTVRQIYKPVWEEELRSCSPHLHPLPRERGKR